MDAIKTYLDNVFAAFPQTEQVAALKGEMLTSMEEKYHALKAEGKSEHEAVGGVIANFGSIDEIAAELGLEQGERESEPGISLSRAEAQGYMVQTKKSSIWIGLGVWLILAGVSALLLLADGTGILALLSAIAVAVALFVVNGLKLNQYEKYEENAIRLDAGTRREIEEQSAGFMRRFTIQIAAGIVLIFLAVGLGIYLFQMSWISAVALPVLVLLTVGFSVLLFITAGMPKSAFDVLLGRGDYRDRAKYKKMGQIIGTVASIYWPLVTAVFLMWGFLGDDWGRAWIIWPVAAVLFGAVSGGISTWFESKGK